MIMTFEELITTVEYNECMFDGWLITLIIGIIVLVLTSLINDTAFGKAREGLVCVLGLLSLFAAVGGGIVCFVIGIIKNDGEVESALLQESQMQKIVVVAKWDYPKYTDYRLRCGRLTEIAARIPKFKALGMDPTYAVGLQDLSSWISNDRLKIKIDEAINLYEIYGNK